jgi:hypothetical protein
MENESSSDIVQVPSEFKAELEGLSGDKALAAVQEHLDSLLEKMPRHFEGEERDGGLFDEILKKTPWEQRMVAQLRGEHKALLGAVERLRIRTSTLSDDLTLLTRWLAQHEAAEAELACGSNYFDAGGGD